MMGGPPEWGAGRGGEKKESKEERKEAPKAGHAPPAIPSTKATIVTGDIAGNIATMRIPPTGPRANVRVLMMSAPKAIPTNEPAASRKSFVGDIGGIPTRIVGIPEIEELGGCTLLASNAFAACVPVIIFASNGTWLAHSNGFSAISQIHKRKADFTSPVVYIIRRTLHSSTPMANNIYNCLLSFNFNVNVMDVCGGGNLGLVVSGAGKSILVYRQTGE